MNKIFCDICGKELTYLIAGVPRTTLTTIVNTSGAKASVKFDCKLNERSADFCDDCIIALIRDKKITQVKK